MNSTLDISASASYVDLTNASTLDAFAGQSLRVDLTAYDAQGRVSCAITRSAGTTLPAAGACASSFENSSYARATLTTHRGVSVSGKSYLAVKTVPPENNAPGVPIAGPESFSDAAGLLRWTVDVEGNTTSFGYDLVGWQTRTTRQMTASSAGTLGPSTRPTKVDTTLTLDLMGRTVQRTDPSMGRRTFVYDDAVSATVPVTMRFDKTGEEVRYTCASRTRGRAYWGGRARRRRARTTRWASSARRPWTPAR